MKQRGNFWSYVEKTEGCWIWRGTQHSAGYGSFRFNGEKTTAQRVAFQLENPSIDIRGKDICHRCDNRMCVRPDHLFLGTRKDNVQDMMKKGRGTVGERHIHAKLTNAQAMKIKNDPRVQRVIAKEYGVTGSTISRIKVGHSYRNEPPE